MRRKVVIVGGGAAGWMSALYFSTNWRSVGEGHTEVTPSDITVIEPANIPPISVGEGSTPTIRSVLKNIFNTFPQAKNSEEDLKRIDINYTKKLGIKYVDWHSCSDNIHNRWYHPFFPIMNRISQHDIPYNRMIGDNREPFI